MGEETANGGLERRALAVERFDLTTTGALHAMLQGSLHNTRCYTVFHIMPMTRHSLLASDNSLSFPNWRSLLANNTL